MVFQQLTGVNAMISYSVELLIVHGAYIATIGTACMGSFGFMSSVTSSQLIDSTVKKYYRMWSENESCSRKCNLCNGNVNICNLL